MERPTQPGDIAREAIRRLASRRQPPTPENFKRAYAEVEGKEVTLADWPNTLRALMRQWDGYQPGLTQTRKREMLERVIINFGANPDQLAIKIANLAKSWAESAGAVGVAEQGLPQPPGPSGEAETTPAAGSQKPALDLTLPLAEGLEQLAVGLQDRWPDLAGRARELAAHFAGEPSAPRDAIDRMSALWREILVRAEDDHELLSGFQRLLETLFSNMSALVVDDAWLQGQLDTVGALLRERLNYHVLHEAQRSLQEVIARQGRIRDSLQEAKHKLKLLISTFIDRVGDLSSSTGEYHDRLLDYSERISRAEDINALGALIDSLNADMGSMREAMRRTHADLVQARSQVEEAESRIQALERQLEEASAMIREDQLTGALNRRGMEEAFERELSRAARLSTPLAVALLDIDHFKRLNNSLGHQAGDRALVHLARVVRQLLRPTDSLARYGGEEFLILLPNTGLDEAQKVMQRVQRELTRQFFMHENQRVLVTFSAGVVQLAPGEDREGVIARADAAMYRAKIGGRNRVERG
jgi:diguanylate cyclase